MRTTIAGLLLLAASASASVMESLRSVPEGWKMAGVPSQKTRLHFRIAVAHQNQDLFEQTLYEVSTPNHPRYGQHLEREELKQILRPPPEATEAIIKWLESSGIRPEEIEDDGEWINFIASVPQAEEMLDTTFAVYQSTIRSGVNRIRTLHYSVPEDIHQYVEMIQPTTRFGQIRPQRVQVLSKEILGEAGTALNVTSCNATITPTCLKELYNIGNFKPKGKKGSLLGVNGFLNEYARFADLAQFEREYAPWAIGANFTWTSVNGGVLDQSSPDDSVEANLDIQYTVSLSYPIPNNFYSTPGLGKLVPDLDEPSQADNQNEPYLDFFSYLLRQPTNKLPSVLSTSYGEDEQSVPEQYSRTVCNMIAQLGARGVSVIFSSGDTGVGSACQTNDGKNTTRFLPIFPAACPYVTSVGGTHYVKPEKAIGFSSGGFSDRFARPAYQERAVSAYLQKLGNKWKGLYNPHGRGFPDVAAQSSHFHVIDKGMELSVGGTSASAPTFSAIVALLNDARISKGLPKLGFLNPWIYSQGYKGLNDITTGGSTGCTGVDQYSGLPTPFVPFASWNATVGWDPVTGYGTPDFQKLLGLIGVHPYGRA